MSKLLVVVDFQNDFIDGALGFEDAAKIKEPILGLLNSHKGDIVFTFDTHDENYFSTKESKMVPILHCVKDSQGFKMPIEFDPFLKKAKKIFYKNGFLSLEFGKFLQENYYESVEFCGLVSHICVFSNILMALHINRVILHQNAVQSFDKELENCAFKLLKSYGVEII